MTVLAKALADLDEAAVPRMVEERLKAKEDPLKVIGELRQGMEIVGERYKKGDYFLSELIMSSEIFKNAMALIQPLLKAGQAGTPLGRVVVGTPRGDIHDIGKNITATLLRTAGFEVFDLGVDVAPQTFVTQIKETGATILGMSALMTPTFGAMKEVVDMLVKEGLRNKVKVIIGGGVTTPTARDFVGADAQTLDAMEGLELCRQFVGAGRKS